MEKQIMIKHSYSDRTLKIKNTISYLELFVDSLSDKIVINCCLNANQSKINAINNTRMLQTHYFINNFRLICIRVLLIALI